MSAAGDDSDEGAHSPRYAKNDYIAFMAVPLAISPVPWENRHVDEYKVHVRT
jgi:hypothetical protein